MSDYTFPALLKPTEAGFSRSESSRFDTGVAGSGAYASRLLQDDAPTYFNLAFLFDAADSLTFRNWIDVDNYAVLTGATFDIDLPVEGGTVTQEAEFTRDGIPQLTGVRSDNNAYSCRIMVRKLSEVGVGNEALILGASSLGGSLLFDKIVNIDLGEL
jgi:hypothetical protein